MDSFQLLDEDQRHQLFILRFLDLKIDDYITISKLSDVTGQSKFKITKFIQALNYDLHRFRKDCKIIIQDDLLLTKNIDLMVIKLLQIDYFKTCQTFPLLMYLLEEKGNIEKYASEHFLCTSKAYAAKKQLVDFLKPLGIKISKNHLVGEEFSIRNTLSTIIFEALNGDYSPFTSKLNALSKKIGEFLTYFYDLRLTLTQVNKLNLLTSISLARCVHKCPINYSFFPDSKKFFRGVENSLQHLSNYLHVDLNILTDELSYISMFLFTEGFLNNDLARDLDFNYFQTLDSVSEQLSAKILCQVERRFDTELSKEVRDDYTRRIKQANRKRAIYSFETSSFSTYKQIQSVNELYPIYSEIIWNVVNESFIDASKDSLSRRFYDYLFILIAVRPSERIEQPMYVCVDFSQGLDYTNFIIKQIERFKDLNLVIETRVTSQTNMLISNCVWEGFKGPQIVWKNPPTPSDWEFFRKTVIRIKKTLAYGDNKSQTNGFRENIKLYGRLCS